jgi:predicted acetyltransferase
VSDERPRLGLRAPRPDDEAEARTAHAELAASGFDFLLAEEGIPWEQYLSGVDRERRGIGLAEGRVPATMLFAVADDLIVGRVHIRHALTPALLRVGGHIGYAVRPAWRGRGFATEMLRQGLAVLRDLGVTRALVTCDDDNVGSIRTIERNGGVLEEVFAPPGGALKRRYWIESGR